MKQTISLFLLTLGVGSALLAGCSSPITASKPESVANNSSTTANSPAVVAIATPTNSPVVGNLKEQPLAPEVNPPGDIPDSQTFVAYTSNTGHYRLDVPEGWARREAGGNVSFVDKLDGVTVTLTDTTTPLTPDLVRTHEAIQLEQAERAVQIVNVRDAQLPHNSGVLNSAVLIQYTSNSEPDPTTGKKVRLENNMYLFVHNGKLAKLRLWAPQGADNVDQWQRISRSFRWL